MGTTSKTSSVLISIGWIRWKMSLIWSDNWKRWQLSNIRPDGYIFSRETGDKHMTTNCLHVQTSVSIRHLWALTYSCIFTHGLTILRWEKRYMRVGMILKMSSVLISIGRIWWKMSLIWSDSWKRWQLSNIRPDMIFNPIILSFCHTIPCVTDLKQ